MGYQYHMNIILCNACNPTFYWPVKCTWCSCRVCTRHGAHSTEKVPFL